MINLLDNAIRYTPSGGKVTAALEAGTTSVQLRARQHLHRDPAENARLMRLPIDELKPKRLGILLELE